MKLSQKLFRAAALAVLSALLLTSCGSSAGLRAPARDTASRTVTASGPKRQVGGSTDTSSAAASSDASEAASSAPSPEQNTPTEEAAFEARMNSYLKLPAGADGWHFLINDYDHDGKREAFVFCGTPAGSVYENIHLFFLPSGGDLYMIYNMDGLQGAPHGGWDSARNDYPDAYLTFGDKTYAQFDLGDMDPGEGWAAVYGVNTGSKVPIRLDIDGSGVEKVPEGFLVSSGLDEYFAYSVRNGEAVNLLEPGVGTVPLDPDPSAPAKNPETVWSNFLANYDYGNESHIFPADYDGDGRKEAYAVVGYFEDGYASSAEIYYIGWAGTIVRVATLQGQLYHWNQLSSDAMAPVVTAGNSRFLLWQMPGAGNCPTYLFGVRNGAPYQPAISGNVSFFGPDSEKGGFSADGSVKYTTDTYVFDSSTGEFTRK